MKPKKETEEQKDRNKIVKIWCHGRWQGKYSKKRGKTTLLKSALNKNKRIRIYLLNLSRFWSLVNLEKNMSMEWWWVEGKLEWDK
jgi:hypothetical protein